jgi:hypothetical protein
MIARLQIRYAVRSGKHGWLVCGRDTDGDRVSIFVLDRTEAIRVRDSVKAGASGIVVGRTDRN